MSRLVANARHAVIGLSAILVTVAPGLAQEPVTEASAPVTAATEAVRQVRQAVDAAREGVEELSTQESAYARRLKSILYADRWNRARSLYEIGDYEAAASYFRALVGEPIGPKARYEVHFRLAESYYRVGAFPGAARYYQEVLDAGQEGRYFTVAKGRLAEVHTKLGQIEKARREFEHVRNHPGESRSRAAYFLGHALAPHSVSEATAYLRYVEQGSRYYPEAQYHLAALSVTGPTGYPVAVSHFTQARDALPAEAPSGPDVSDREKERIPRLHELLSLSLARTHTEMREFERALSEYDRVPPEGRYRDEALLESAWVLLQLDEVTPALQNVQALLNDFPQSERVLEAALLVGYLTIEQGKFNEAYGHFEDTRALLERLNAQLAGYAASYTAPEDFYHYLVERRGYTGLPQQIGTWIEKAAGVQNANSLLAEVKALEVEMRDVYRKLDELEVMAAGPRGGYGDPAWLDNLIRLELSNRLYRLQQRILELRVGTFLSHITDTESSLLRQIRRIRSDLLVIRNTPSDVNAAAAGRQQVLSQLSQYLLQIHPEIGLDLQRDDEGRVAEVEHPLWSDEYLRESRKNLAALSREVTLDDRWFDAALEYTVYLEDRLQRAAMRRLGIDERYEAIRIASVLFRQSAELQHTLRLLGNALADIQESILLETQAKVEGERQLLAMYQEAARDIGSFGGKLRGLLAQETYARVATDLSETAVLADLGALDTGWRVKELEDRKVRELLSEKQDRLAKLNAYYERILESSPGDGPYEAAPNLNPQKLAEAAGNADSPYGQELYTLSQEVIGLARALELARMQQDQLESGARSAVLSPSEMAAQPPSGPPPSEGLELQIEDAPRIPGSRKTLPINPGGRQ